MMFEMKRILFCIQILVLNAFLTDCSNIIKEKPAWLQSCRINEPDFVNCSTKSVQQLMTQLFNDGIPEVNAILGSFEPKIIDKVNFHQDNNQAVNLNSELYDIELSGLSKLTINESRVSKKNYSWRTKMFFPKVHLKGNYKMKGKILLIPLNGSGKFFMHIDRLDVLMRATTHLYEKEGFIFSNVTGVSVELSPGDVHVNFENIFNGNKQIEQSTNEFFNTNWPEFFEVLRPLITQTVEETMLKIMQTCFDILPSNFLTEDIATPAQLYGPQASA